MAAASASALAPIAAPLPPFWSDRRIQIPLAFVGATLLAVGTFTVLHFALRNRAGEPSVGERDERGYRFPEAGYVVCPKAEGALPTTKDIKLGSFVILSLGSPTGAQVQPAWARVAELDLVDPTRIVVVLVGEATAGGEKGLRSDRHGFQVGQPLWITKDCVWDVLHPLHDPGGQLLCGAALVAFAKKHPELVGVTEPALLPGAVSDMVGRTVELYLVSSSAAGALWQIPITVEIVSIGNTGHVATVKVIATGRNMIAESPPPMGHTLAPGQAFDITWDCVTAYL